MTLALVLLVLSGCAEVTPAWSWPEGIPAPRVPEDNPMTLEKVRLGESLFFDEALSSSGDISCASCHDPARAFTEPRAVSLAAGGTSHTLNAPTLINSAWSSTFGWANKNLKTHERHAIVPLFGEHPVEIGLDEGGLAYAAAAYDVELEGIVDALAAYQRSLVDLEPVLLDDEAARGQRLFEQLDCVACHAPPLYTRSTTLEDVPFFAANGLTDDAGLFATTFDEDDRGKYKVPTLLNVAETGPYLHDGRLNTLEDVVDAYDIARELELTPSERNDLLAFLRSL